MTHSIGHSLDAFNGHLAILNRRTPLYCKVWRMNLKIILEYM